MEVTSGLLVAMMFIMVLSIGIGNILMSFPPLLDGRVKIAVGRTQLSWLVLLLLIHLRLFWHALLLLDVENWGFEGLLYTVGGPILLLLATSMLLPDPSRSVEDPIADFIQSARRGFLLLSLVMAWQVGFDQIFGTGLGPVTLWNGAAIILFFVLASSGSPRVHGVGAVAAWALFLSLLVARGVGAVS